MSTEEQIHTTAPTVSETDAEKDTITEAFIEQERTQKILKAKEMYSHGSRNYLVKSYAEAADDLSQVCALYEELYGELSDELGMPYLLYAKSLIALALDENKVIDVPDEESDDDEDSNGEGEVDAEAEAETPTETNGEAAAATSSTANGAATKLETIKEDDSAQKSDEADSTADGARGTENEKVEVESTNKIREIDTEEAEVSSTADGKEIKNNGVTKVIDDEKPSTSNGDGNKEEIEDDEVASSLQLAWEILELAAKIFSRQGERGLPNLAEVQTELANIEFENNISEAARDDYTKALRIYSDLPSNYRRAMAEIHYKIGLTYLMQQLNKEGAASLKEACTLIDGEIEDIKSKSELSEKDNNNIQDMEETKQEIWAKIAEIEEMQAQNIAEVRAALDSYIKPITNTSDAGPSSSVVVPKSGTSCSAAITSSSKPTDISHLIKRKKTDDPSSEAEAAESPAKRPAI